MENKSTGLFSTIKNLCKSKVARFIAGGVLMSVALILLFLADSDNSIRIKYLQFLDNNYVHDFLSALGIKSFDFSMFSWIIIGSIFVFLFMMMLSSIWKKNYVESKIKKAKENDPDSTYSGSGAKVFFTFVQIFISLAFVGILLLLVSFIFDVALVDVFKAITVDTLMNVLLTLGISLAIIVLTAILVLAVYFIVYWFIALIIIIFTRMFKDVKGATTMMNESVEEGEKPVYDEHGNLISGDGEVGIKKNGEKDMLFAIAKLDEEYKDYKSAPTQSDVTLEEFILQFQSYAINNHKIYYELPVLRSFVAGMASSRLIILEGLSGTGKSMLPRMFTNFTQSKSFFAPVQATWRDKSDMLGYYSEFTKIFKVTDFLKKLYSASFYDDLNIMVLDEMNLSRIEYYFADFLSIIEYPKEDWKVRLIEPEIGQKLPVHLEDGYVRIPANTWFIGTANTDDSTFTITDKVYDRAFVIDFSERFSPISSDYKSEPLHVDSIELEKMFEDAKANPKFNLTAEDEAKFLKICDLVRDRFDIHFGNRIMNQINNFVPVYVAMGGKKEEALDVMFARKILRKLNGMYDEHLKVSLIELRALIRTTYGRGLFNETEKFIDKFIKRLV